MPNPIFNVTGCITSLVWWFCGWQDMATPPPSSNSPPTLIRPSRDCPGQTPRKKLPSRHKLRGKKLFESVTKKARQNIQWTKDEQSKLLEFLLLFTDGKCWVMHKDSRFWVEAGRFIQQSLHSSHCRSGKCRSTWIIYFIFVFQCRKCSSE